MHQNLQEISPFNAIRKSADKHIYYIMYIQQITKLQPVNSYKIIDINFCCYFLIFESFENNLMRFHT